MREVCRTPRKLHHANEEGARKCLESLMANPKWDREPMHVYECPCGRGWCIGHDMMRVDRRMNQSKARA